MDITEKDIKYLRQRTSKKPLIALLIISIILLLMGLVNLWTSNKFASLEGLGINQIFAKWFKGIDTSNQYSGLLIRAIERLQMAFTQIIIGIFLFIYYFIKRSIIKKDIRILEFIEEKTNKI